MGTNWKSAFENYGVKRVTKTDKDKAAFVPNAEQKAAMSAAGLEPGEGGGNAILLTIQALDDPERNKLETSYYNSLRESDPKRVPEARMGREFIHWAEIGDEIVIGNIGDQVYAWKAKTSDLPLNEVASTIASTADEDDLLKKAREAQGKPLKQTKTISDFKRSLAVVAGALKRANGMCEMPACATPLFRKDDGANFLEVHHIVPLGEDGDDTLINAAALCPMCHRELHYGADRKAKRSTLQNAVKGKEP